MKKEPTIAIVGIGGIFPGAHTLEDFWDNVSGGIDAAQDVPEGRWLLHPRDVLKITPGAADKVYSIRACFIEDFKLDVAGLGLDPDSIARLDPMCHLLLHAGREAFSDAVTQNLDKRRVGVIIGNIALPTEKSTALALEILGPTFEEKIPGLNNVISPVATEPINRYVTGLPGGLLARALGLAGATFTIDAACASSLYALKLGADALKAGRADAMLVGGLSRPDCMYTQMGFSQLRALSAQGRCAPFDVHGDGLVVGEGAGIVVIKRLEDALRDGDHIYGTIRGTGLSNDVRGNLLAPDSEGQLRAMRPAYTQAGWRPWDVDFIECHATGTPVGDRVEFESLRTLWGNNDSKGRRCVLGAVKSNIGHLLTGAGAAGLIKTLMAIKNKTLPPTANFVSPNPGLRMPDSPFEVLSQSRPWQERDKKTPRRAAVSAFGFGGINAHVLIEEWLPETGNVRVQVPVQVPGVPAIPIAIVGMEASFGPWTGLGAFQERVLGGDATARPGLDRQWWGVAESNWFQAGGLTPSRFRGFFIDKLRVPLGKYRIPPKELEEMLPQQLLMLEVAAAALKDGGYSDEEGLQTGLFIGIGLDLCTTNFHFRWSLSERAREWTKTLGLDLTHEDLAAWVTALRDAAGEPLTANRTMGALGGIVASRIAREFRIGGPSHTLSSEESSAMSALEVGIRALQRGEIDQALVGAVDFTGDIRVLLSTHAGRPYSATGRVRPFDIGADGTIPGEGAAAVMLKRLDDAVRDANRIYAVIRGIGAASGGRADSLVPDAHTYESALKRAYQDAGVDPATIRLLETHGSGSPEEDCMEASALRRFFGQDKGKTSLFLSSVKGDIGHAGAASGLASLVKASISLYQEILPPLRNSESRLPGIEKSRFVLPQAPQYWLRNRAEGPRRAGVSSFSVDGNCIHVVLEAFEAPSGQARAVDRLQPLGVRDEALFAIEGADADALRAQLDRLHQHVASDPSRPIEYWARKWWQEQGAGTAKPLGLALVARDGHELMAQLGKAQKVVQDRSGKPAPNGRIFFSSAPLGKAGEVAFVFPGSGNHFVGMGQDLSAAWPEIFRHQDQENDYLHDQFVPDYFWHGAIKPEHDEDHKAMLFGQVCLGAAVSDILCHLGVKPDAVIGYSLGESVGLFAFRAWPARDEMLKRMNASSLFTDDLAGRCRAARKTWNVSEDANITWAVGVVDCPAETVREVIKKIPQVYLLIVNTLHECVVGGEKDALYALVEELGCGFVPLHGVTTAHCEVVKAVEKEYRDLHLFETTPPAGIRFYSTAWGKAYPVNRENAADSILAQVLTTLDFPRVINNAYADGVRLFLEIGPGASCTRMIASILGDRPHMASSACFSGKGSLSSILELLGRLIAERVPVDLEPLYGNVSLALGHQDRAEKKVSRYLTIPTDGPSFQVPHPPGAQTPHIKTTQIKIPPSVRNYSVPPFTKGGSERLPLARPVKEGLFEPLMDQIGAAGDARAKAHGAYLRLSDQIAHTVSKNLSFQMDLLDMMTRSGIAPHKEAESSLPEPAASMQPAASLTRPDRDGKPPAFDRDLCLEFARGSISNVLGSDFVEIDSHPTRVRLPDEPLMLVDRILEVHGQPHSMTSGRVVTEHDIHPDAWYLDNGRIPTCIAVEAGQADLFLSGYLGIDLRTRGLAVYRLLDADVTFHNPLPGPGEVIRYDIRIESFFQQDNTYLFQFNFDGTVTGAPILTMRNGCAGFFTQAELAAGRGIVHTDLDKRPLTGRRPDDWKDLAPMKTEAYSDEQIRALRAGDLTLCFGAPFEGLSVGDPLTIPAGRMKLVDRVLHLDPHGGRYGLGTIRAEADIHPDDWFLTCHFVDDRVMPGTLMFECCQHTLRIFLLRMGWVGEKEEVVCEPVPGVTSRLKCRGQVIETTKKAAYEISIKELGYNPEPYAIADALMYADGKPIVEITDMSVRLSGLTREKVTRLWEEKTQLRPAKKEAIFDRDKILAFAVGKPSEAFGEPYRIFDKGRVIARLPGPPYQFIDRITEIHAEPWKMAPGGRIEAQYDIPSDAWYLAANRYGMPFAVLLEVALQPCGWLAAYIGSALTSDIVLSFRNLGGTAVQLQRVDEHTGTLTTKVTITKVSASGGMIIQHYDFDVSSSAGAVYQGNTYFGFFSKAALAQQIGIVNVQPYQPKEEEIARGRSFPFPSEPPYPEEMLRMIDHVRLLVPDGGPDGLGLIRGTKSVDPDEWFFKAHFYQDPVCPGSLGLESFLQLLKVVAVERWGIHPDARIETVAIGEEHRWIYRGQVIPKDSEVTVEAVVTRLDDDRRILYADGYLSVDGRIIYRMEGFTVHIPCYTHMFT